MGAFPQYNERVCVTLGRSRRAEGFVAVASIATLVLIAATPLALEAQLCAIAWTGGFAWIALRRLRSRQRLEVDGSGAVAIDGTAGRLRAGSFVAPWLAIVRWRPAGAWLDRTVVVVPDRLPAGDFRLLRVLLKWSGPASGPAPYSRSPNAE